MILQSARLLLMAFLPLMGRIHAGDLSQLSEQDFTDPPLSPLLLQHAKLIPIKEFRNTEWFEKERIVLFYRKSEPPEGVAHRGDVLLLHGAAYSSKTWAVRVGQPGPTTMQILAAAGYTTVAIDQPGFPRESSGQLRRSRLSFMVDLLRVLHLSKPAIVSPSASGSFSLEFVSSQKHLVGAYIPVAPCCPHSRQNWQNVTIPLLIVRGDGDGALFEEFQQTPYHNTFIVPKAGHAAYLHQPDLWHAALVNFLNYVFQPATPIASTESSRRSLNGRSSVASDGSSSIVVDSLSPVAPTLTDAQQQKARSLAVRVKTIPLPVLVLLSIILAQS